MGKCVLPKTFSFVTQFANRCPTVAPSFPHNQLVTIIILLKLRVVACQVHIGSLSSELRSLHEKSLDLGVRLKNRKVRTILLGLY